MDEALLRQLLATAPDEFVAARNAAAKSLRSAKERDAAAMVAAIRRLSWPDWALNVVAGEDPDLVEGFADAASTSRDAQAAAIEGRRGPDVRASLRDLRTAVAAVARRAGEVLEQHDRPAATADLTSRLVEVAGDGATSDDLLAGLLGAGASRSGDLFAGLEPASRPARAARPAKKRAVSKQQGSDRTAGDARRKAAAERKAAAHQLERAEREHRGAMRDLARADADLERVTTEVDDARSALQTAQQELDVAERRLDGVVRQRTKVAETVDASKAALDEARAEAERTAAVSD